MLNLKSLWLCIIFISIGLIITPNFLFADEITIRVPQSAWNTGTVFSDYSGWGSTITDIRPGKTTLYSGMTSGGWARFDTSSIPDGSQINNIQINYTVYEYYGGSLGGVNVDIMQISYDPMTANFQTR